MKKNLLEIVQAILSDMDSEDVNSISETQEALQVAKIVEQTYYDYIATRNVPEHESLIKLTALSDSSFPTHFEIPTNVKEIRLVWYDVSDDNSWQYRQLEYVDPITFLNRVDKVGEDYTLVDDKTAGTKLRIKNNIAPDFYTSFDDFHLVLNSHKSTVDSTLQETKTRAIGTTYPIFSLSDDYTPDLDATAFPYLIQESKSRCFSILKGAIDQKIEQAARRQKTGIQNDTRRNNQEASRYKYGRRVPR